MIFRQFLHASPIAASYLFGCGGQSQCVVVDPVDEIKPYLQASHETGMRIVYVIDTHVHADHVSGGRALARAVGAPYLVHESVGGPEHSRLRDAQEMTVGNVTLRVLHTPGHTPEHVCLLVTDRTRTRAMVRAHWTHADGRGHGADGARDERGGWRPCLVRQRDTAPAAPRFR